MIRRAADVAGGYEPVASKLLLGAEVPLVNLHVRAVIADRCPSVAFRVPRQSQPRRKIPPLIVPAGFAGESRIAIEEQAGRCVIEAGALDALVQGVHIEMSAASIQIDQREEWLPTQAVID